MASNSALRSLSHDSPFLLGTRLSQLTLAKESNQRVRES